MRSERGHLARVGSHEPSGAGDEAGPGRAGADRVELAGIALRVPEPIDPVALHEAHGAGVVVGQTASGPSFASALTKASATMSSASSQPMRSQGGYRASPLRPIERFTVAFPAKRMDEPVLDCGCARHSARPWRRSRQPCSRCRSEPRTRPMVRASRTSTSSAQVDGRWSGAGGIGEPRTEGSIHGKRQSCRSVAVSTCIRRQMSDNGCAERGALPPRVR